MKFQRNNRPSQSKPQLIEWRVSEDERDCQLSETEQDSHPAPVVRPRLSVSQWTLHWGATFLLVLVVLSERWVWYRAQTGLDEIETELQAAIDAELWLLVGHLLCVSPFTKDDNMAMRVTSDPLVVLLYFASHRPQ